MSCPLSPHEVLVITSLDPLLWVAEVLGWFFCFVVVVWFLGVLVCFLFFSKRVIRNKPFLIIHNKYLKADLMCSEVGPARWRCATPHMTAPHLGVKAL